MLFIVKLFGVSFIQANMQRGQSSTPIPNIPYAQEHAPQYKSHSSSLAVIISVDLNNLGVESTELNFFFFAGVVRDVEAP